VLGLKAATDARWLDQVDCDLPSILVDHAHCEKKAAGTAMNLMFAYPGNAELCREMADIVVEELEHFRMVLDLLETRSIKFRTLRACNYGRQLNEHVRKHDPQRAIDRLLVGALIEARYTTFDAKLTTNSPLLATQQTEFTQAKAPLPAIGIVARGYPLKEVAINFEMSTFRLPAIDPKYDANYFDWDINGTVNVTNNVGLQVGWRKMTTYLRVEKDLGDLAFKGLWFGAAARF
jgi:hypothetical protein